MPAKGVKVTSVPHSAKGASFAITSKSKAALFGSPTPAGRRITAGFSYIQRVGKSAAVDMWFPDCIKQSLDKILAAGEIPGPSCFPAEWAAVRQFELLQEAGNHRICDLAPEHLGRTLRDLTHYMRGGGYRVTVATIGSYDTMDGGDDLEILDQRLQDRISHLISMLYLEEQSEKINADLAEKLRQEKWSYQTALPHVGVTLGARHLFRPHALSAPTVIVRNEAGLIPAAPHQIRTSHANIWTGDVGVTDSSGEKFTRVTSEPAAGQYSVAHGIYQFAGADTGREILISYCTKVSAGDTSARKFSETDRKHLLSKNFFEILNLLPQKHILHDTAIGLQLPESINENQWIYIARDGEKLSDFARLMDNLFAPFNKISMAELDGRAGAGPEIKPVVAHVRSYGDRLNANADNFYRNLAHYTMH